MMDTLFLLGQQSRLRILEQAAARVPGCAYLCAWAPIPGQPSSSTSSAAGAATSAHLLCLDAWLCDGGRGDDRVRALFDAYRGSFFAVVSGCVPGWAYKDGRAYMELPEHDLAASASLPVQQQFYEEAGIKVAAFMGCGTGEIEVGMSAANGARMNLQATVEQVFSEEFFQQSLLEELLQLPPTRPSSSSSSLPSVSVGSPADGSTSLLRTMAMSSATPSPRELTVAPLLHARPPHPVPFGQHGHGRGHGHFPSAEADDAAMAQAMLAVISAASPSALPTPSTPPPGNHRSQRWPRRGSTTAFRAYNAALAPRAPRRPPSSYGQRMIKMGLSILRRMDMIRCNRERTAGATTQQGQEEEEAATAPPSSSQLHHMISERRRRERLNESFEVLRGLLPPGSKKDKATVLAKTLDYMNLLIAQISDLEAKNRSLEAQIHQRVNGSSTRTAGEVQWLISGSPERVQVQVSSGAGPSTSSSTEPRREVTIRVVAHAECDLSELVVRVIALLKEMGRFTLVSVDATQPSSGTAQASLTLRATAVGFDEASLEEAVTKAVEGLVTPPRRSRSTSALTRSSSIGSGS